jgi:3-hydroxyisobutyrate dehydrogenase
MEIGLCGTGRMGAAMVLRLIDQGHQMTVWNRSAEKLKPLLEKGAHAAKTPSDVAAKNAVVITMLTDDKAVDEVYSGKDGLLSGDVKGKLFIDMSTVTPAATRKIAAAARAKGAALVECPVGGTIGPAREGKLLGLAGGEAADFARAKPILDQLCRRVDHLGANGNGSAMKLAINLPLIVYWEALGEALSLMRDSGISAAKLIEVMQESSGANNALKTRPQKLVTALEGGQADVGFDLDSMRKDLRTMAAQAQALGVELPVTLKTLESFDAASKDGWGARDGTAITGWRFAKAKKK